MPPRRTEKTKSDKAKPPSTKPAAAKAKKGPKPMSMAEVETFISGLSVSTPDPQTELAYSNPFTLLVAVTLSAQTTDIAVNKVTPALFRAAPDPAALAKMDPADVGKLIQTIGLWQGKARHIVAMARLLMEKHGGEVPQTRAELEALPGVGRKTANVVLNVAFGQPTMAVDTHIFRIGNRTGLAPGKTPRAVEDGLVTRIPTALLQDSHHLLILHGRYICKARKPECWRCPVAASCKFAGKLMDDPATA